MGNVILTNVAVCRSNADNANCPTSQLAKLEPGQKVFPYCLFYTITQNDLDAAGVTNSATANALDRRKCRKLLDLSDDPNNPANVDTNGSKS
jgi:hypothetical protein